MEPTFTTRWFFQNIEGGHVEPGSYLCAVCGLGMEAGVPVEGVLRKTFTDHAALRVPASSSVCPACEWYFGHQELRRSSWWLTAERALSLAKAEVGPLLRGHLRGAPAEDGYYLVTTMKRKHLALWAPLNLAGNSVRRVRFETVTVELDTTWLAMMEAAHRLREIHSWREIRNDDYNAKFLTRWESPNEFMELRSMVQPWLGTAHLDLAQYVWCKSED